MELQWQLTSDRFKTRAKLSDVFTHVHTNANMFLCAGEKGEKSRQQTYARHVSELCAATRNRATTHATAHMPRPGESVAAQNK